MISFIPLELTPGLLFFIGVYYLVVIMLFWRNNISKFDTYQKPQYLLLFLIFIHLLFAFEGGDYFHYYERIVYKETDEMEFVYSVIIYLTGYNYLLFRAIIWGSAFGIFLMTAKRFGLDFYRAAFLLYVMFFTVFDYARASLAMAIYFYGLSFICVPVKHHRLFSYFFSLLIIISSVFFHRSMIFPALITSFALVPLNKKTLTMILLLFVMSVPFLNYLSAMMINIAFNSSGNISESISGYANQVVEMENSSMFEQIRRYIEYGTFFVAFLIISCKIFNRKYCPSQSHSMQLLFRVTFGILLFAVTILVLPFDSLILFYRFLYIAMIPIVLLFLYMRESHMVSSSTYKWFVIACLLNVFFNYSKRLLGGNI